MVNTCAPGCKSAYHCENMVENKPTLSQFPQDEELIQKWIKAYQEKIGFPQKLVKFVQSIFHSDNVRDYDA